MAGTRRDGAKPPRRANGEGSIYQRTQDKKWIAALSLPDGRRPIRTADSKSAAQQKLREMQSQYAGVLPVTSSDVTVERYFARWLADIAPRRVSKHAIVEVLFG